MFRRIRRSCTGWMCQRAHWSSQPGQEKESCRCSATTLQMQLYTLVITMVCTYHLRNTLLHLHFHLNCSSRIIFCHIYTTVNFLCCMYVDVETEVRCSVMCYYLDLLSIHCNGIIVLQCRHQDQIQISYWMHIIQMFNLRCGQSLVAQRIGAVSQDAVPSLSCAGMCCG